MIKFNFKLIGEDPGKDYVSKLVGSIHKLIDNKDLHDTKHKDYNFSWLLGYHKNPNLVDWELSIYKNKSLTDLFSTKLIDGNYEIAGYKMLSVSLTNYRIPSNIKKVLFYLQSPVVINKSKQYITYKQKIAFDDMLKSIISSKARRYNLDDNNISVNTIVNEKSKVCANSFYKNNSQYKIISSFTPIEISANPDVLNMIYYSGLGNNTGMGFGSVKINKMFS